MKYPFRLIRIAFPALRKNRHFMAVIGNAHERFPCFQYNGGIVRIFFPCTRSRAAARTISRSPVSVLCPHPVHIPVRNKKINPHRKSPILLKAPSFLSQNSSADKEKGPPPAPSPYHFLKMQLRRKAECPRQGEIYLVASGYLPVVFIKNIIYHQGQFRRDFPKMCFYGSHPDRK